MCLISRLGQDEYGKKLHQTAEECGINVKYLIPDPDLETPHSYIFSNKINGSRTLFNFPGNPGKVDYRFPEEDVSVILSDGHEPEITLGRYKNILTPFLWWMQEPAGKVHFLWQKK